MMKAITARKTGASDKAWRERIAAQEQGGLSVKQFCEQQGFTEQSFYYWRKRLRKATPMRFALVEAEPRREPADQNILELVLTTGERLRISAGVDSTRLRQVLEAVRG